jgi:glutamate--cysteine ligase
MIQQLDPKNFHKALRGLEKENLRVSLDGALSKMPHEAALKTSANDPHYTLDFAECQLEVVTGPHTSIDALFQELQERYHYVHQNIQPELLWPNSMPPNVPEASISIAHFGNTANARTKERYREGLIHRYGKMMQVISGIHYNFSLPLEFFQEYQQKLAPDLSLTEIQNQVYFKMIHYYLERYWLLLYFFGAAPIACEHSLKANTKAYEALKKVKDTTYLAPYATSIRQSDLGYHNPKSCDLMICFKDLECYIRTLEKATQTPFAAYKNIPDTAQLNPNYLQIENEFYAPIRPKQPLKNNERPLTALKERGVAYLEVRVLDINPLLPFGVAKEQLAFIELLLLTGLFHEKTASDCNNFTRMTDNALKVCLYGRDPYLQLQTPQETIGRADWAELILAEMATTADFLQQEQYHQALKFAKALLQNPNLLPSAQIAEMAHDYQNAMLKLACEHQRYFL